MRTVVQSNHKGDSTEMAERPLSPHLTVYRWQLTMVTSILHRATGAFLAVASILVLWWLYAIAAGPDAYAMVQAFIGSWLGRLILMALAFCTFFHLFNGLRHLMWDTGHGLQIEHAYLFGWIVVALSIVATAVSWYWILGGVS